MTGELRTKAQGLGRAIEVQRTLRGMKRKDLAHDSGLSYPYISEIENGAKEPSAKALRQIANALGWSVAELVGAGEALMQGESASTDEYRYGSDTTRHSSFTSFLTPTSLTASRLSASAYVIPDELAAVLSPEQFMAVRELVRSTLSDFVETELPRLVAEEIRRRFANPAPGGDDHE